MTTKAELQCLVDRMRPVVEAAEQLTEGLENMPDDWDNVDPKDLRTLLYAVLMYEFPA